MEANNEQINDNVENTSELKWWEKPFEPQSEFEQEVEYVEWNPDEFTEKDGKALKRIMSLPLIPHEHIAKELGIMVKTGRLNPIEAFVTLKRLEKIFKLTLDSQDGDKELRELIFSKVKAALDGGKSLDIYGATLSIRATGVNYDYSECGDKVLDELYVIQNRVKELITTRQNLIKNMFPDGNALKLGIRADEIKQEGFPSLQFDDNEWVDTIFAPIKRSGESAICTFKKLKN